MASNVTGSFGGRVNIAEEDFRQRIPSLLAWIPGMQKRRYFFQPAAHVDVPSRIYDHNGLGIFFRNIGYQIILSVRQFKSAVKTLSFIAIVETDANYRRIVVANTSGTFNEAQPN